MGLEYTVMIDPCQIVDIGLLNWRLTYNKNVRPDSCIKGTPCNAPCKEIFSLLHCERTYPVIPITKCSLIDSNGVNAVSAVIV